MQPSASTSELTPLQKELRLARTPTPEPKRNPLEPPIKLRHHKRSELKPSGNGTFSKDQAGWAARVGRDGRVTFKDKPSFRITHFLPCFSCMKAGLRDWAKNPEAFKNKPKRVVTLPIIGGTFDVTDWIMRRNKQDPYSYQKAQFLERTRPQRMRLAAGEKTANLRNALFSLRRNLEAVWTNIRWSLSKRRLLLFELWDECAEVGSREVLATAAQARVSIVAFIRHQLPAGSAHAYTASELRKLNARKKSRSLFTPYEAKRPE